jgi:quercetin dioxygenase-like cupin family protein
MSYQDQQALKVLHVPAGAGPHYWVYDDEDTIKLTGEDTDGRLAFIETLVPPGGGTPRHVHHTESESIYVLDGELDVLDNGEMVRVEAGGLVHFPQGILHQFRNPGQEQSKILILFTPAGFEKFFMEIGEPVVEGRPGPAVTPDYIRRANRIGRAYGQDIEGHAGENG